MKSKHYDSAVDTTLAALASASAVGLQGRFGDRIRAVIFYRLPFNVRGYSLLVVVGGSVTTISKVYQFLGPDNLKKLDTICLREYDLFQLALPSPDMSALSRPYWIKEDGIVVFGEDLRHLIPVYANAHRLLGYHLDWIGASRHHLLACLMA